MRVLSFAVAGLLLVPMTLLADAASVKPALIASVAIGPGDSPLVRAAKIAVASRLGVPSRVIDNSTVASATRTLTTTSVNVTLPNYGSTYTGAAQASAALPSASAAPKPSRAELQRNLQQLNQENARMHDEADQPYGGDVSEDRVQQRIEQIPQEIQGTQQQLTPMPPSHPPGSQP